MISVLLVDDHALVRKAIKNLLSTVDDIKVIGEADSGQQALNFVRDFSPDIILLDLSMPGMSGLETTQRFLRLDPKLKIIILTTHENIVFISLLLKSGAIGYLTKNISPEEMIQAVYTVSQGRKYLYAPLAQQLLTQCMQEELEPFLELSAREIEILWMICRGAEVDDMAQELYLSKKSVHAYRYSLFKKLNVGSDVELTRLAIERGIYKLQ